MDAPTPKNELPLLDKIINKKGYTWVQYKHLLIYGLIILIEGSQLPFVATTILTFQKIYNASSISIISGAILLGVCVGSYLSGFSSKIFSRTRAINLFFLTMTIFTALSGIVANYLLPYTIFRFLIGVCLGGLTPLINNLVAELLPIKLRGFCLAAIWALFNVGILIVIGVSKLTLPNNEPENIHATIYYLSLVSLIVLVIMYFGLEDSPRDLLLKGQDNEKAFNMIEKDFDVKLNSYDKDTIIHQIHSGSNEMLGSKLSDAFSPIFLRTTILCLFIWFCISFCSYGTLITFYGAIKAINPKADPDNENLIVLSAAIIGVLIGAILCEVKTFGRRFSITACSVAAALFFLLIVVTKSNFVIFYAIANLFASIVFNIILSYTTEVYPTIIRDIAVGFLLSVTRFAGFLSQFVFLPLLTVNTIAPYILALVLALLMAVLSFLLPYETYGHSLDDDMSKDIDDKVDMKELHNEETTKLINKEKDTDKKV